MVKCELLVTETDGQIHAGMVTLDAGNVTFQSAPGYAILMDNVKASSHVVNDARVSLRSDAEAWFNSLPSHYNGSRLRARMVGE